MEMFSVEGVGNLLDGGASRPIAGVERTPRLRGVGAASELSPRGRGARRDAGCRRAACPRTRGRLGHQALQPAPAVARAHGPWTGLCVASATSLRANAGGDGCIAPRDFTRDDQRYAELRLQMAHLAPAEVYGSPSRHRAARPCYGKLVQ